MALVFCLNLLGPSQGTISDCFQGTNTRPVSGFKSGSVPKCFKPQLPSPTQRSAFFSSYISFIDIQSTSQCNYAIFISTLIPLCHTFVTLLFACQARLSAFKSSPLPLNSPKTNQEFLTFLSKGNTIKFLPTIFHQKRTTQHSATHCFPLTSLCYSTVALSLAYKARLRAITWLTYKAHLSAFKPSPHSL